jgi:DNA-binding LacI/PurR family transcriptional regulator
VKPSLQDVAKRAKVSASAASAALRGGPAGSVRLAAATRQRILKAAQAIGYQSNPLARGLRGQTTRTVGVLWWLGSPPSREFMARRLARTFQQRGYATYIADHFSSPTHVAQTLGDFALRGVDGVVLDSVPAVSADPTVRAALRGFRASVVVKATDDRHPLGTDVIIHDRRIGIRQAIDHLVATGRRRPLFLMARYAAEGKADAFKDALRRHGIILSTRAVIPLPPESPAGNAAHLSFAALADRFDRPSQRSRPPRFDGDAVLTTSDELAVGALAWLRRRGLRVPQDVAVVGFNESHVAPFLDPPLASVDRREEELVDLIQARLFQRLEQPDAPPTQHHVCMQFIWRESAGGVADASAELASPAGNHHAAN